MSIMDIDNALPPPSARRRVVRNGNTSFGSSQAGPSRLLPEFSSTNVNLNLGEEQSRLLSSFSDMDMDTPVSLAEDTPAARLRAIMSRIPTDNSTRADAPPSPSPSDRESDFDPPNFASSVNSSYRGSLKSLMSRALRPPGDTPQKGTPRPRRNSIDTSEVDSSPRAQKVKQERLGARHKRRSHSDEEAETSAFLVLSRSNVQSTFSLRNTDSNSRHLQRAYPGRQH